MPVPFPAWALALARLEGAIPFLPSVLADAWALASLRRLWRAHHRSYPFENIGLEDNAGPEAEELMRSWQDAERRDFLSWIVRRGSPAIARAAQIVLAAKQVEERVSAAYDPADTALARLEAHLPTSNPQATLLAWITELHEEEIPFREGDSEWYEVGGHAFQRSAPRGAAWAASLAAALRPQLFGLGSAPFALAGIAPRSLFRTRPEALIPVMLDEALDRATADAAEDLSHLRLAFAKGEAEFTKLKASSQAPATWRLLYALGPCTRAELARALGVTRRTASQAATTLENIGFVQLRAGDNAVVAL